jgi:xanthine/CO dehydrogenase XdhC/CoxF family maturation factor
MKEIVAIIEEWKRHPGEPLALATLVRAQGSSYRRPGARMLICPDGTTAGSLSGGCLEEEVAARALEVMRTTRPALMEFDTRRRFGCNGAIQIFVEPARESFLVELSAHLQRRESCCVSTIFSGAESELGSRLLRNEISSAHVFVQQIDPPIRLIIFGQGPDSAPLRTLAENLGWEILEANVSTELPTRVDAMTAAIVKSHNYGRDCAALRQLLQLGLRYVGLLGPRRRRDEILGDLLDSGVSITAELFAPAGLDLGAETPAEIALAIVAEIQTVFAQASGESLRDRKVPIHGWNAPNESTVTAPLCRATSTP